MTNMLLSGFKAPDAHMLHDHLESVVAAAYQMRTETLKFDGVDEGHTALLGKLRRISDFARTMQALELTILLKVTKAREWCERLGQREYRLTPVIPLFIASTGIVLDRINEAGDLNRINFHGEHDTLSYLKSRGYVLPSTPALDTIEGLGPCESVLLLGELPLSPLAETCRTFSDVIETHFKLFRDDDVEQELVQADDEAESTDVVAHEAALPDGEDDADTMIVVGGAEATSDETELEEASQATDVNDDDQELEMRADDGPGDVDVVDDQQDDEAQLDAAAASDVALSDTDQVDAGLESETSDVGAESSDVAAEGSDAAPDARSTVDEDEEDAADLPAVPAQSSLRERLANLNT